MTWIFLTAITVTGLTFSLTWALVQITSKPTSKQQQRMNKGEEL
jgi:hypothetical protein